MRFQSSNRSSAPFASKPPRLDSMVTPDTMSKVAGMLSPGAQQLMRTLTSKKQTRLPQQQVGDTPRNRADAERRLNPSSFAADYRGRSMQVLNDKYRRQSVGGAPDQTHVALRGSAGLKGADLPVQYGYLQRRDYSASDRPRYNDLVYHRDAAPQFVKTGGSGAAAVGKIALDAVEDGFSNLVKSGVIKLTGDPIKNEMALAAYKASKTGLDYMTDETDASKLVDRLSKQIQSAEGVQRFVGYDNAALFGYIGKETLARFSGEDDWRKPFFPRKNNMTFPMARDVTNYAGDGNFSQENYDDYIHAAKQAIAERDKAKSIGFLTNFLKGKFGEESFYGSILDNQKLYFNRLAALALYAADREARDYFVGER